MILLQHIFIVDLLCLLVSHSDPVVHLRGIMLETDGLEILSYILCIYSLLEILGF
jgi:hypothetical protein